MRILHLWLFISSSVFWTFSALGQSVTTLTNGDTFVYPKSSKDFFAINGDEQWHYIPSGSPMISVTNDWVFYSLDEINRLARQGRSYTQFDGAGAAYVAMKFDKFWSYFESNYADTPVFVMTFVPETRGLANANVIESSPYSYTMSGSYSVQMPYRDIDGTLKTGSSEVYAPQWNVESYRTRVKLTFEGRVLDDDVRYNPYTGTYRYDDSDPDQFYSGTFRGTQTYPYLYEITVFPTNRSYSIFSSERMATLARKRPNFLADAIFMPSVFTTATPMLTLATLSTEAFNLQIDPDDIESYISDGTPSMSVGSFNGVGLSENTPDGSVDGMATLNDVIDALSGLEGASANIDNELPEWTGYELGDLNGQALALNELRGEFGEIEDFPEPDQSNVGSFEGQGGDILPAYLEFNGYKFPLGAMFKQYPWFHIAPWIKLLFTVSLYFSFGYMILNDSRQLFTSLCQVHQTTGNTEFGGGIVIAELNTKVPSVITNFAIIGSVIAGFTGVLFAVLTTDVIPSWNFGSVVQGIYSQAPYIIKVTLGLASQIFPVDKCIEIALAMVSFKISSLTAYGAGALAIKGASF
jgi:hypothetical protein